MNNNKANPLPLGVRSEEFFDLTQTLCLVWKVLNVHATVWIIFQHLLPYNRTLKILLLNTVQKVFWLSFWTSKYH